MSLLDVLLLGVFLAQAFASLAWRRHVRFKATSLALLALGCGVQLMTEGFYWQWLPCYLLLLALALPWLDRDDAARGLIGRAWRSGIVAVALIAVVAWAVLPVPQLPAPRGPFALGSETFRWIDPARPEPATDDPSDHRNVIVQAWYPAEPGPGSPRPYIDGLDRLPRFVSLLPGLVMANYGRMSVSATEGAAASTRQARWPVVLFSPGFGASRAFYTSMLSDLASHGVVVLALDHPFEAAVVELADGHIATPRLQPLADDPDQQRFMAEQQTLRADDLRFVLDKLDDETALGPRLQGRLDTTRIAAIGHSFGGASAAQAMAEDIRIDAAANLDGTLYGALSGLQLDRPLLLIESDRAETGHSQRYLDGNHQLLTHSRAVHRRVELSRANHYSFTDVPLYFSAPARAVLAALIGGSRGTAATVQLSNDVLLAFLQQSLHWPLEMDDGSAAHGRAYGSTP